MIIALVALLHEGDPLVGANKLRQLVLVLFGNRRARGALVLLFVDVFGLAHDGSLDELRGGGGG